MVRTSGKISVSLLQGIWYRRKLRAGAASGLSLGQRFLSRRLQSRTCGLQCHSGARAWFSQPTNTSVLALRRERYALSRLIRRIAARERAAVNLRIVQYGVTRERLHEIADSADGWDVLHLAGHGTGGVFVLEKADGSPDPLGTTDLLELLRPMRRRVRLAVVSACESAADTTAETLRLIGLTDQAQVMEAEIGERPPTQVPGLTRALVRELDCAVVGMRYPVVDEFAIAFGNAFYEHLLGRRQAVDAAVARALAETGRPKPSAARPALSMATPGVFGAQAADLVLTVPRAQPDLDPSGQRMANFPGEPPCFVGRAEAMAKATEALAPGSDHTAVLLYGMAGAGKTWCALELAYHNADRFGAAAFWQAPSRDAEWASALPGLAKLLEIQFGDYGFTMAAHIGTAAALEKFLPRLRRVMESNGLLLVLDNLETLLTPEGTWRDPRWENLVSALTDHDGESRVILTSRIAPSGRGTRVLTLPVHALSLEESAALARELPNLRELLHADPGPLRAPAAETDADRNRVRRLLLVVQGHPKLLELADAAADRDKLDALLAAAEKEATGQQLEAFFREGASTLDPDQFLNALSAWTTTVLGALPEPTRRMAQFMACLEDTDRRSDIINASWAEVSRRLDHLADPSSPGQLLNLVAAAALARPEVASAGDDADPALVTYLMHPGVAAALRAVTGPDVRTATDSVLGAYWQTTASQASTREGGEDTPLVVRSGLAGASYLLRLKEWEAASRLLEHAVRRDGSPGITQAALPGLRRIADATRAPEDSLILARGLRTVNASEAEQLAREVLRRAVGDGNDRLASLAAGELITLLGNSGQLGEALDMAGQSGEHARRAGLGPLTQLVGQGQRLQILSLMGEHERVLAEISALREEMGKIAPQPTSDSAGGEAYEGWNVREAILDIGRSSALALGDSQQCLELNAGILASRRQRGAAPYDIFSARLNDADPLIQIGRLEDARLLLAECQQVFEDHADTTKLAQVLDSRATLESAPGHSKAAEEMERAALRFSYVHPDPSVTATAHRHFADYMEHTGDDRDAEWTTHQVTAALIYKLTGMAYDLAITLEKLTTKYHKGSPGDNLPLTVAEVVETAEHTEGVCLRDLLTALEPDSQAAEDALADILRTVRASSEGN